MDNRTNLIIGGGVAVVVIIVVLILYSYDSLEPREYGILYNSIDKTINREEIYSGGRHWVGLFDSFIHFPSGLRTIEFSGSPNADIDKLNARTNDGVSLGVSLSFQYTLNKDELPELYDQSNTNYESTFVSIARDIVMQTVAAYEADTFWTNRNNITDTLLDNLDESLQSAHASCVGLQLLEVTIPTNLEESIVATQVEKQLSSTKVYEREAELIRQDIDILNSQCDQNITTITAAAEAEAYYMVQVAEGGAKKKTIDIQADIYMKTRENLGFTDDEFTNYLFLRALQVQTNATIAVGLDNAAIQIIV